MSNRLRFLLRYMFSGIVIVFLPVYTGIIFLIALFNYVQNRKDLRFVWGPDPLINNIYWSRAMRRAGYISETFTYSYYRKLNNREDWGVLLQEKYSYLKFLSLKQYVAFLEALIKYDIFVIPFSGFFLGSTPLWRLESFFFRLCKKKVIVIPYGGDSYVYRNIRSTITLQGLLMSYPYMSRNQERISKRVKYWCKNADVVITGFMGVDGFGRWDVLVPNPIVIDINAWRKSNRNSIADGRNDTVYIAHAPNHHGVKGSEFIIDAISNLKNDGLKVELILIEHKKNDEVRKILEEEADILVDQLIISGHGLNAIEGMAVGIPTISNLENNDDIQLFRYWTYFDECPLVSASPETITENLRKLVTQPKLRHLLGTAGRQYVEKYHSMDSAQYLFGEIIEYFYGRRDSLINLYHPILGEYNKRKPMIKHPLVKNHINNQ